MADDPFAKYKRMQGKFLVTIDGNEYSIDASLNDKKEFVRIKDGIDKGKMSIDVLFDYMLNMLKKSYPDQDPKVLEVFLTMHSSTFMDEMMIGYGFITRDRLEKVYNERYSEKKNP